MEAVVRGRVQGVGYRWWTKRLADALGADGAVWNRNDGSVGIQVQGTPDVLDRFLRELRRGPGGARVDTVETRTVPPLPDRRGFSITFPREGS